MIVENELTTPLGIAAANTEVKMRRALGSLKAMIACCLLKDLFLIPLSFDATRLTAIRRSRGFKNRAFAGVSGSKKKRTNAQRHVAPPRI